MRAELESKELLTFCVKKVKGLSKVKLVDAGFIWTEPHSRRLKIKVTIQKEVLNGAILQQTFVVEFVVEPHMCEQCQRSNTNSEVWVACVQVRQKVSHKRTFLFLEQLILKHGAEVNSVGVKEAPDGLDFFYGNRSHALKMVDFLGSVVAIRTRADKQLVSADHNSNTFNYKYTFCVEIVPVCKEDLVCMPHKVYTSLGGLGPLLLCARVSNQLTLVDVATLRTAHVDSTAYYRAPYRALVSSRQLTEFVVLDCEPLAPPQGRWQLAEALVARVQDFGRNDTQLFARTHLGQLLKAGDTVLGYDVQGANMVDPELDTYKGLTLPDVILVRKSYAARRRARREKGTAAARAWTLRRLNVAAAEDAVGKDAPGVRNAEEKRAADEEAFLEELEEDPELRARIALYRAKHAHQAAQRLPSSLGIDSDGEEIPEVPLEELLDELALAPESLDDMEDDE